MQDGRNDPYRNFLIEEHVDAQARGQIGERLDGASDRRGRIACKTIAAALIARARSAATSWLGRRRSMSQGEAQMKLDVLANDIFVRTNEWGGQLAGMVSEEMEASYAIPADYPRGKYLLLFDPLDGSSNIDVNVSVGIIFSVLRVRTAKPSPTASDFLQPGQSRCAAGYAIYGPATMLVLTIGSGTHGFTLDREIGEFMLTHPDIRDRPKTLASSRSTPRTSASGSRPSSAM